MANVTIEREESAVEQTKNEKRRQVPQEQQLTKTEQTSAEQTGKQEVSGPDGVERTRTGKVYLPAVDIYETDQDVVLVADMPGVDENSVDVSLEKNVLTIYGRVEPQVPAGHTLAYAEYRIGDYQRSFTISNSINWERIEGVVKNGVLRLTLPKAGPASTKKILVKSA
jgi:HSP20 family protein